MLAGVSVAMKALFLLSACAAAEDRFLMAANRKILRSRRSLFACERIAECCEQFLLPNL
jgi:hypothetical protein